MVELVGTIAATEQPELADQFMAYVLSGEFQQMIPTGNWSLPAALPRSEWPEGFDTLPLPDKTLFFDEVQAAAVQDEAIEEWRRALSR